jgi:hypothetical protein
MPQPAELATLADGWLSYWLAPNGSPTRASFSWVMDREYELVREEPEVALLLILEVLRRNQSNQILQVLSAGPHEDLLAKHGERIIVAVEREAKINPSFATLLGGVWQNDMSTDVWARVQAAWDRRGWDGIPEA